MADKQLKNLAEISSPETTDIVYLVHDPSGTPADKKITLANLLTGMKGIKSDPPVGGYQIANIYLDASLKIVVVYNETPIS